MEEKILSVILIALTVIGLNIYIDMNDYSVGYIDLKEATKKQMPLITHHLAVSHKIKNNSYNRELSNNVTQSCHYEYCMVREVREYIKEIPYNVTGEFNTPRETLKKGYGDCKSKAILGGTILSLQNITTQYAYQKDHICLYVPEHGFINCFSDRPIRYMSPVIRTKP